MRKLFIAAALYALSAGSSGAQTAQTYVYDVHGRITGSAQSRTGSASSWTGYGYDPANNRAARQVSTVPALAAGHVLASNEQLVLQQSLRSPDLRMTFSVQSDGNLLVYFGSAVLWSAGTYGSQALFLVMQGDGNLVLYGAGYIPVWASGTSGNPGAILVMQSDGNLVIYQGSTPIWFTGTGGH